MTFIDIVDISNEDELVELDVKAKLRAMQQKEINNARLSKHRMSTTKCGRQEFVKSKSPNDWSTGHSNSSILDQVQLPMDDTSLSSKSPICQAPICRQFWKAGKYDDGLRSKVTFQSIELSIVSFVFEVLIIDCV